MIIEEVINCAYEYLGLNFNTEKNFDTDILEYLLVFCTNIVLTEVAQEYLPLTDEKVVEAKGGVFSYSDLPKRVNKIVSVRDENGNKVSFRQRSSCCKTGKDGKLTVEYRYLPEAIGMGDECDVDPAVSAKTLAFGVAAEYCMLRGMYDKSEGFAERFRQDMRACVRPAKSVEIKNRGWY